MPRKQATTDDAPEQEQEQASPLETQQADQSQQVEKLQRDLAAAKAQLQKFGIGGDLETIVRLKIQAGLTREQAIECARRQVATDALNAEYEKRVAEVNKDRKENERMIFPPVNHDAYIAAGGV